MWNEQGGVDGREVRLDRSARKEAEDADSRRLPEAMHAVLGLQVRLRIPVGLWLGMGDGAPRAEGA